VSDRRTKAELVQWIGGEVSDESTVPPPVMTAPEILRLEMWRGLNALYLEVPESIADDVKRRVSEYVAVLESKLNGDSVVISRKELESTGVALARLADGKREDSAVFSRLYDLITRWLTPVHLCRMHYVSKRPVEG
jgi:hypothetical protein